MIRETKCFFYLKTFPKRLCEVIANGLHEEKSIYNFPCKEITLLPTKLCRTCRIEKANASPSRVPEEIIPSNELQFASSDLQGFGRHVFSSPHNLQEKAWQREKCGLLREFYSKKRPHASSVNERVTPKSHTGVSPNFSYLWVSRTE